MIYEKKFSLTGSGAQQKIVADALAQIKFPFEKLVFPKEPVEIGWKDLNGVPLALAADEDISPHLVSDTRSYILGVMYPNTGEIFIDNKLINNPSLAASTVSAEIAHDVDYYLPLTDTQKQEIINLIAGNNNTDGHTWWEKGNYNSEYYTLYGEAFMQFFTGAYSDIKFGSSSLVHTLKLEQTEAFRKIINIERTDSNSQVKFFTTKTGRVFHKTTHKLKNIARSFFNREEALSLELKACKICKP